MCSQDQPGAAGFAEVSRGDVKSRRSHDCGAFYRTCTLRARSGRHVHPQGPMRSGAFLKDGEKAAVPQHPSSLLYVSERESGAVRDIQKTVSAIR